MPALEIETKEKLALLEKAQRRRTLCETVPDGAYIVKDGKKLLSFSGNDYLGLKNHPAAIQAAAEAAAKYGAGAGASRLVSGNHPLYAALEHKLAEMKGLEKALVFGSGYLANLGVISALAGKGDAVFADKLSHACILDGTKLSGAEFYRFAHNSIDHLSQLLTLHRERYQRCLILTETVFSMDGDRAPLLALAELAKVHDAALVTDDAHGFGVVDMENPAAVQVGTLSKAAGVYGGYVCASTGVIDFLMSNARTLIFTTALPPAVVASAIANLEVMGAEPWRGENALAHARYFTRLLKLPEAESAIVPVILGESEAALKGAKTLEEKGFFVAAIRPPTVPLGKARLRITFSALHMEADVEALAEAVGALLP